MTIAYYLLLSLVPTFLLLSTTNGIVDATDLKPDAASDQDFEELGLHYGKYLKEVVAALDQDHKFTQTIKNMDANDIKSGKVADQLKHVHEDIRKKLNDLKYLEIKRLRDLATRKNEMEQYGETYHGTDKRKWRTLGASLSELPEHLGSHGNDFDVHDLQKLMVAATNDLEKLDKERREDYKTYEMEKEWQFQERLKMMNETEKADAIKLREEMKKKHDDHPKVHEPGTKQQFEEVWESKDHLPKAEFDPRTFFNLHDINSDNYWDQQEVRKLLETEINKLYDPNNPEDDPNEMEEEFERMREHIYKEIDLDKDGLISLKEFLDYSKKPEFKNDNGWEDVNRKEAYSKEDYEKYLKNRDEMMRQMHGHYDPSYYANQPQNFHLPNYGFGMPAGAHPAQYYGYQVDPNHPQAQQILAAQQQQHAAYQQAAYQQQAAAYQHPAAVPQHAYQQPQVAGQQYYQAPHGQQAQQQPAQINYQPPPPQQHQQQQQQQPIQQAPPVQAPQAQNSYQQPPQAQPPQQQQAPVQASQPQQVNQQYYQAPPAQPAQYQQKPAIPQQQQQQQQPAQANFQQPQQAAPAAQQVPQQPPANNYQQPQG